MSEPPGLYFSNPRVKLKSQKTQMCTKELSHPSTCVIQSHTKPEPQTFCIIFYFDFTFIFSETNSPLCN